MLEYVYIVAYCSAFEDARKEAKKEISYRDYHRLKKIMVLFLHSELFGDAFLALKQDNHDTGRRKFFTKKYRYTVVQIPCSIDSSTYCIEDNTAF